MYKCPFGEIDCVECKLFLGDRHEDCVFKCIEYYLSVIAKSLEKDS